MPPHATAAPLHLESARQQLRAATSELHRVVDQAMPLAQASVRPADYALHLAVLRDWMSALAGGWPALPGLAAERARVERDLRASAALGVPGPPALRVDAGASGAWVRGSLADAAGWGVRYVIEGSQLGGRVLHRRLAAALAPHPLKALRCDDPQRWLRFLAELEAALPTPPRREAACAAARASFDLLLACLHLHLHPHAAADPAA